MILHFKRIQRLCFNFFVFFLFVSFHCVFELNAKQAKIGTQTEKLKKILKLILVYNIHRKILLSIFKSKLELVEILASIIIPLYYFIFQTNGQTDGRTNERNEYCARHSTVHKNGVFSSNYIPFPFVMRKGGERGSERASVCACVSTFEHFRLFKYIAICVCVCSLFLIVGLGIGQVSYCQGFLFVSFLIFFFIVQHTATIDPLLNLLPTFWMNAQIRNGFQWREKRRNTHIIISLFIFVVVLSSLVRCMCLSHSLVLVRWVCIDSIWKNVKKSEKRRYDEFKRYPDEMRINFQRWFVSKQPKKVISSR